MCPQSCPSGSLPRLQTFSAPRPSSPRRHAASLHVVSCAGLRSGGRAASLRPHTLPGLLPYTRGQPRRWVLRSAEQLRRLPRWRRLLCHLLHGKLQRGRSVWSFLRVCWIRLPGRTLHSATVIVAPVIPVGSRPECLATRCASPVGSHRRVGPITAASSTAATPLARIRAMPDRERRRMRHEPQLSERLWHQ